MLDGKTTPAEPSLSPTPVSRQVSFGSTIKSPSITKIPPRPQSTTSFGSPKKKKSSHKKSSRHDFDDDTSFFSGSMFSREDSMPKISPHHPRMRRDISTPEWTDAQIEQLAKVVPPPPMKEEYDIVKAHYVLEIYEQRIQEGTESRYNHPAQARLLAESEPDPTKTDQEVALLGRYKEKDDSQMRPLFWIPRVWDTPDKTMTPEESLALKEKIEKISTYTPPTPQAVRRRASTPKRKTTTPAPRVLLTSITLSSESFLTDVEELTDYDDF